MTARRRLSASLVNKKTQVKKLIKKNIRLRYDFIKKNYTIMTIIILRKCKLPGICTLGFLASCVIKLKTN